MPPIVVNGRRQNTADLGGLLGTAIQSQQQCRNDAVHSTTCAALEQDTERLSSSLQHDTHIVVLVAVFNRTAGSEGFACRLPKIRYHNITTTCLLCDANTLLK